MMECANVGISQPLMCHAGTTGRLPGSEYDTTMTSTDNPASPRLRCFLVEDSPVIRENLIATLQEMLDINVLGSAEDELSAVSWMREETDACDLIIIDIFLKSGTGLEVLRKASTLQPGARRVVLTNFATQDMRQHCLQLGADAVFDKSAELEELIAYCESLQDRCAASGPVSGRPTESGHS
jgi:DNA-binding NarL/FixJ family response regulator